MRAMRRRLGAEEGVSIVVAVAAMAVLVMLSGVAVQQAVSALQRSARDENVKKALQAADAAVDSAIFQLNRLDASNSFNIDPLNPSQIASQVCVATVGLGEFGVVSLPAGTPDSEGRHWCPGVRENMDGGAQWEYRVSQLARVETGSCDGQGRVNLNREIVAVGTSNGVSRRIHAKLNAALALLSGAAVQSGSSSSPLTLTGTTRVLGDVHSNHDIVNNLGAPVVSGDAIAGPGHVVSGVVPVGTAASACHKLVLPLVKQGNVPSSNDNNATIDPQDAADLCYNTVTYLSVPCKPLLTRTGDIEWDAAKKTLRLWGNARLKLTGENYSFCSVKMEGNAILQVDASTSVTRIFMEDPATCSGLGVSNGGSFSSDGSSRIVNCHGMTAPETLQLYAVGNASTSTSVSLLGGSHPTDSVLSLLCGTALSLTGTPMVVYAPRSQVTIGGSTAIAGQVAGDVVTMSGAAAVQPVAALSNIATLGGNTTLPLYQPEEYVECTAVGFSKLPANEPTERC